MERESRFRARGRQARRAIVRLSHPPKPTREDRGQSSSTGGRQSARASNSTEGRTSDAGIGPKTVTPPRLLPTAGAAQGPALAEATGPWGRTSPRLGSNRTATATAGAPGANRPASDLV